MTILIIIVVIVLILFSLVWFGGPKFGNEQFHNAIQLEKENNFKEACYTYAIAILNGSIYSQKSKGKIKEIWKKHGPFDFEDILRKEIETHGDTPEHCAEAGHAATVSIIKEIVNKI